MQGGPGPHPFCPSLEHKGRAEPRAFLGEAPRAPQGLAPTPAGSQPRGQAQPG